MLFTSETMLKYHVSFSKCQKDMIDYKMLFLFRSAILKQINALDNTVFDLKGPYLSKYLSYDVTKHTVGLQILSRMRKSSRIFCISNRTRSI